MTPEAAGRPTVLVVGTGLIGTSVGLALRDVADVLLDDVDEAHVRTAVERGAGTRWNRSRRADLALVAAPPSATASTVVRLLRSDVAVTFSHVASSQSQVQADVETMLASDELPRVCGGHPLAGREVRGPAAASGRLFQDRPWAVCPGAGTSAAAVDAVRALAVSCGALPVVLSAGEHDAAVALVSHLPQVASSALAAQLDRPGEPRPGTAPTELAGPGLQDMTRIAGGDPDLWLDILATNAARVAPLVRALAADLEATADALDALAGGADRTSSAAAGALREVLARGNRGRARVPVKGGRALVPVVVAVRDEPGQLAALLADAASSGVNVEDVHVEHLPHRDRGMVELLVAEAEQDRARRSLGASGWDVRPA